jgi:hypothetical protein
MRRIPNPDRSSRPVVSHARSPLRHDPPMAPDGPSADGAFPDTNFVNGCLKLTEASRRRSGDRSIDACMAGRGTRVWPVGRIAAAPGRQQTRPLVLHVAACTLVLAPRRPRVPTTVPGTCGTGYAYTAYGYATRYSVQRTESFTWPRVCGSVPTGRTCGACPCALCDRRSADRIPATIYRLGTRNPLKHCVRNLSISSHEMRSA